jgi:transposase-like protein
MAEMLELVPAGSFCWNKECTQYGQTGAGNIRRYGRTRKGVQRYQCKGCKQVFSATRGTPFYGVHDIEKVLRALAAYCERPSLRGVQRMEGVKPDTLAGWIQKAAAHVELIERLLQERYPVTRAQLDGLWAFVGHKGEKGATRKRKSGAPSGARG